MPNIKIEKETFHEMMGRQYKFEELDDFGFQFGIEIQECKEANQDNIEKQYYKFDCMNNRPDLLTEASLTRIFKIYLQQQETPKLTLSKPTTKITIHPSVKQIRPFVVGAILRNIKFTDQSYKAFITAQEKLHATFCRARKYASIGTHDFDKVQGPFNYIAKDPKTFTFVPLNQEKEVDGLGMMESLENHKLKEYLHLIRDSPVYPLVTDKNDKVCSVPPIINSEYSKISKDTKNVFIEVTALSRPKAMVCLKTLVWAFSEYCEVPFEVEPVEIVDGEETQLTPNISDSLFIVSHKKAEIMVGAPLTPDQIIEYLKRSGMSAKPTEEGTYQVQVPCWRVDVMHECDILEDIAICYGYQKVNPTLPPSSTIGSQLRINKFVDLLRHELAQGQFDEALNFALCSKADLTSNIFNTDDSKLITIENAKTKEFQTGRTTLLPGLLRTIIENKSTALPFKLFEAGDCIILDETTDTGSRNVKKIAAVYTDEVNEKTKKNLFSMIHGLMDVVLKKCNLEFGKDYHLEVSESKFFFPGQQFEVILKDKVIGSLGVVHPLVLKNFGWYHPTVMWQLDIEPWRKVSAIRTNDFQKPISKQQTNPHQQLFYNYKRSKKKIMSSQNNIMKTFCDQNCKVKQEGKQQFFTAEQIRKMRQKRPKIQPSYKMNKVKLSQYQKAMNDLSIINSVIDIM